MTNLTTFVAGTKAKASEVNNNFTHRGTTGTTSVSFVPTSATATKVLILAQCNLTLSSGSGNDHSVALNSNLDGDLSALTVAVVTGEKASVSLHYFGVLSAGTHTLTITISGSGVALGEQKITVMEFLA